MIIYAVNVHSGGGKVLLDELLRASTAASLDALFVDKRYPMPEGFSHKNIFKINPSILARIAAEFKLKGLSKKTDCVLMFGNLPPIFKLNTKVVLYLQNVLLLPSVQIPGFNLKTRLRLSAERVWLQAFKSNVEEVWVQTKHVAHLAYELFEKELAT